MSDPYPLSPFVAIFFFLTLIQDASSQCRNPHLRASFLIHVAKGASWSATRRDFGIPRDRRRVTMGRRATSSESEDSRGVAGTHETTFSHFRKGPGRTCARYNRGRRRERKGRESPVIGQRGTWRGGPMRRTRIATGVVQAAQDGVENGGEREWGPGRGGPENRLDVAACTFVAFSRSGFIDRWPCEGWEGEGAEGKEFQSASGGR